MVKSRLKSMQPEILQQLSTILTHPKGYFVTATDTNVGKTYCAALIQKALNALYFKPIQCGDLDIGGDTEWVKKHSDMKDTDFLDPIYEFQASKSPNQAASDANRSINIDLLKLPETKRKIIVEGAGGVLVPLNDSFMMIDLIKKLGLPVILVVRSELGTLNHSFLTLEALKNRNIPVDLLIINGQRNVDNYKTIQSFYKDLNIIQILKQ